MIFGVEGECSLEDSAGPYYCYLALCGVAAQSWRCFLAVGASYVFSNCTIEPIVLNSDEDSRMV